MGGPGQVTADGDARVLAGICFQCLPMEDVASCQDFSLLVGHDADDIAFAWVKFYLPHVFPVFERIKVFSKEGLFLLVFNSSVRKAVVCKKSGTGVLDCIR